MPAAAWRMRVFMEDGAEHLITYDQRDIAKMEALELKGRNTVVRGIAWAAMTRSRKYSGTWEQFNEADCVEAGDPPDAEEATGDDSLDPGRPEASG